MKRWRLTTSTCETRKAVVLASRVKGGEAADVCEALDEDLLVKVGNSWAPYIRGWNPDQKKRKMKQTTVTVQ